MHWMLMPLRRYADFTGRSRRMEFWMWVLFQLLIGLGFLLVLAVAGGAAALSGRPEGLLAVGGIAIILYFVYLLVGLAFLVPGLAVTVRRLHDTDRSGWWVMLFWGPWLALWVLPATLAGFMMVSDAAAVAAAILAGAAMLAWIVGSLVLIVLLFLEGTRGPNRFGPDPKQPAPAEIFA